jgi:hypothetical protein
MVNLGDEVKDTITGFKGIAIGKASYLTGCDQCAVQPKIKDGSFVDAQWFDIGRLEVVKRGAVQPESVRGDYDPGCDIAPPGI